ncbi:MAG: ABC transporter permease [Promethearchaeota archaeon]|nr:MAG: ABC transporter permease [Candidatus Lokiarchaeota archaeon]
MVNDILEGILEALRLMFTFDPELWSVIGTSFRVSLTSTFLAALVALPIGSFIGLREFRGKKGLTNLINTFMGFPPVVMGLIVYLLLSRNGPFGALGLLFSTTAMIVAQFLLAVPIIIGTAKAAIESVDPALKETVLSLGANERQLWWELIKHSRKSIIAGYLVAFGQAISEVGAVMIVGGNIRWETRTFTTSIVLQARMAEFGMAIALGLILILIALIVNYGMTRLQSRVD